ncbi:MULTISPECIES: HipA domain-containing protein [Chitinophagaceae]
MQWKSWKPHHADIKKLLEILIAPGASLGGARPKANIKDENGNLWIARFPSKSDTIDCAAWEYLAYRLAVNAKIEMSPCKIEQLKSPHRTFFTKRFDREGDRCIHFLSAMTMARVTMKKQLKKAPQAI